MLIKIHKNRSVSSSGTWGTKNENNYEILNFEFPEELEEYNKRIVYYLGNQKVWDPIIDNKAILTNAITTKGSVKAYIWCTKSDEAFETDVDFRTQIFVMNFFENDNADGIVPTPEQVDGFNTMLTAMNNKITEIDTLETAIEGAEADRVLAEQGRVNAENTRVSNENTRQSNEQTRQTQEANREQRTNQAIAQITDMTEAYNQNAQQKTEAFNQNATNKTNDFNDNASSKKSDFDTYVDNAEQMILGTGNTQVRKVNNAGNTQKEVLIRQGNEILSEFNSNATSKTNTFNSNAENKTTAFNTNASDKTTNFDNNASSKTSDFNTNAESKTNTFNDNATAKTTAFNDNAQAKTEAFDEHTAEITADIEELQQEVEELSQNMPWNETEQGTYLDITDAAKYSKNKLELFGNTSQVSYQGYNLVDVSPYQEETQNGVTLTKDDKGNIILNGTSTVGFGWNVNLPETRVLPTGTYTKSITKDNSVWSGITISIGYNNSSISRTTIQPNIGTATMVCEQDTNYNQIRMYIGNGTTFNNYKLSYMILSGEYTIDTIPDYEPYTGGQPSPNPDYPQPIHVVTGDNTIRVETENLFDKNNVINNYYLNQEGTSTFSGAWSISPYIEVQSNLLYSYSGLSNAGQLPYSCFYDANKNILSTFKQQTGFQTMIIPNNARYLRFSILKSDLNDFKITKGTIIETDYPLNLGSLELCKIGDYQDTIFKNTTDSEYYDSSLVENGWYKYNAITKVVLNGTESWNYSSGVHITTKLGDYAISDNIPFSTKYVGIINGASSRLANYQLAFNNATVQNRLYIKDDRYTTPADFKTYLQGNNVPLYYVLREPTKTQITDETLISQLEAIYNHLALVKGTNHITITPSDLAPYVVLNYMQDLPSKLDNLDSRLALLE